MKILKKMVWMHDEINANMNNDIIKAQKVNNHRQNQDLINMFISAF